MNNITHAASVYQTIRDRIIALEAGIDEATLGDTLEGLVPASRVHEFEQALPGLSQGEGVFFSEFHDYRPYPGPPPSRPRTDGNPLDRKEYLRYTNGRT